MESLFTYCTTCNKRSDLCQCLNVYTEIGKKFDRDGRHWCVSVRTDTFIIATDTDAVLDSHGEPSRDSDIIKVML